MEELTIRVADVRDAARLLRIYAPYVEQTAVSFEYDVPTLEAFEGRIARVLERYPYLVAEDNGEILGYAYAGPFSGRPAYDWAVETTVYVAHANRRQGIGGRLYEALEHALAAQHILNANACIAVPQGEDPYLTRDSALFHARMGYRLVGEFHQCGYKFSRWYDVIWMEKHLGAHTGAVEQVRAFGEVRDLLGLG